MAESVQKKQITLRPYQQECVDTINNLAGGSHMVVMATGLGKCLAPGTPVLMYSGIIKAVEDVKVGDLLMGPDSKPRTVTSLAHGEEEMFQIIPKYGIPYTVNRSHILCLAVTGASQYQRLVDPYGMLVPHGAKLDLTIDEYKKCSKDLRHALGGYSAAIEFSPMNAFFSFFELGQLLATIDETQKAVTTHFTSQLAWYELEAGKRYTELSKWIPKEDLDYIMENRKLTAQYLAVSKKQRMELLSGYLKERHTPLYDGVFIKTETYCEQNKPALDQMTFIANSLGYQTIQTVKQIDETRCRYTTRIYGKLSALWQTIDRPPYSYQRNVWGFGRNQITPYNDTPKRTLHNPIKIKPVGIGEYFGFTLKEDDRRFLLGDCTVTHNTATFSQIDRKGRVLLLSHREELVHQPSAYYDCTFGCERAEEHSNGEDVVSASVQTMTRRLKRFKPDEFDTIITDEAHHAAAPSYKQIYSYFKPRLHLGFTATPNRGDRVRLDDVFQDIIFERDLKWGIDNHYLCNIECMQVDIGFDLSNIKHTRGDFDIFELANAINDTKKNEGIAEAYRQLHKGQTLIFAVNVAHAKALAREIEGAVPVTAETENRNEIIDAFTRREIPCITSVGVFTEGVDLPLVETVIMARPTENNTLYTQCVGRGLRLYPGKDCLRLIDCVGIADKRNLCTAPSLLGLDPKILPKRQRKKLSGLLTDLESQIQRIVETSPESWIISTRNINVFAEEQNYNTHDVNWKAGYDGSFTCSFGKNTKIVITPVNELGLCNAFYTTKTEIGYFGKDIPLQTAFDRAYDYLSRYCQETAALWNMNIVRSNWGRLPASEKQLTLIRNILQSPYGIAKYQSDDFDISDLSKYEASIIIERLLE